MMRDPRETVLVYGKAVDGQTGLLVDAEGCCTNWEPVELGAGSIVTAADGVCGLKVSRYEKRFDEALARTYSYDEESNWTTFIPCAEADGWVEGPQEWTCPKDCFVRITARLKSGDSTPEVLGDIASLQVVPATIPALADGLRDEIQRVSSRVEELREPGDLVLIVLSDIHYATGCIWPESARVISEVAGRIHPDAIVQLGDVTDGVAPVRVTRQIVGRVLDDLRSCGVPVLSCVGNHDVNYFKGNTERLSPTDCARLYTGREDLWYYEDFPAQRTRCFFLRSFDPERKERYGYDRPQLRWLRHQLRHTPRGWKVLMFSHVTPYAQIHWWSNTIRCERPLMRTLNRFNRWHDGALAAFVHGHSHVDQVFRKDSFPCISIGCAKFEDFQEYKPAGSHTPSRELGTASQELWDVLILKGEGARIELVRFGAGEDRSVDCHGHTR